MAFSSVFGLQENTAALSLDQVVVGQWRSCFVLPQDSNAPHLILKLTQQLAQSGHWT